MNYTTSNNIFDKIKWKKPKYGNKLIPNKEGYNNHIAAIILILIANFNKLFIDHYIYSFLKKEENTTEI